MACDVAPKLTITIDKNPKKKEKDGGIKMKKVFNLLFVITLFFALLPASFANATPSRGDTGVIVVSLEEFAELRQSLINESWQIRQLNGQQRAIVQEQQKLLEEQAAENLRQKMVTEMKDRSINRLEGLVEKQINQVDEIMGRQERLEEQREKNIKKAMPIFVGAIVTFLIAFFGLLFLGIAWFFHNKKKPAAVLIKEDEEVSRTPDVPVMAPIGILTNPLSADLEKISRDYAATEIRFNLELTGVIDETKGKIVKAKSGEKDFLFIFECVALMHYEDRYTETKTVSTVPYAAVDKVRFLKDSETPISWDNRVPHALKCPALAKSQTELVK